MPEQSHGDIQHLMMLFVCVRCAWPSDLAAWMEHGEISHAAARSSEGHHCVQRWWDSIVSMARMLMTVQCVICRGMYQHGYTWHWMVPGSPCCEKHVLSGIEGGHRSAVSSVDDSSLHMSAMVVAAAVTL